MPFQTSVRELQKVLSYLPGTYGTSLLKNHMLNGVYREMKDSGFPEEGHYTYPRYAGLQSGFSRSCGDCKSDDCDYGGKCACVWRNLSVYDGTAGERSRVERNIDYCSKKI